MTKAELLAELAYLKADELADLQAKLDELLGETWLDEGELSDADKTALDVALADYNKNLDAGSPWQEVKARIQGELGR